MKKRGCGGVGWKRLRVFCPAEQNGMLLWSGELADLFHSAEQTREGRRDERAKEKKDKEAKKKDRKKNF